MLSLSKRNLNSRKAAKRKENLQFEQLEPRILLSADLGITLGDLENHSDIDDKQVIESELQLQGFDRSEFQPETIAVDDSLTRLITSLEIATDDSVEANLSEQQDVEAIEVAPATEKTSGEPVTEEPSALTPDALYFAERMMASEIVIIDSAIPEFETLIKEIEKAESVDIDSLIESARIQESSELSEVIIPATPDESDVTAIDGFTFGTISEQLQTNADRDIKIFVIDSRENGIEQVSGILDYFENVAAVHLISHGSAGALFLGNSKLNVQQLKTNQQQLKRWGNALSANGDLLLYGCNVAEGDLGLEFVEELAAATDADVAASNDLTGNALLGGDWDLEATIGVIESPQFFTAGFAGYSGLFETISANTVIAEAADLLSAGNIIDLSAGNTNIVDLRQITGDYTATLSPGTSGSIKLKLEHTNGNSATYVVKAGDGGLETLMVGSTADSDQNIKVILNKVGIGELDARNILSLQFAIGKNETDTFAAVGTAGSVAVKVNEAVLDQLHFGKAGSGNIDLILLKGGQVNELIKATDFPSASKLNINLPDGALDSSDSNHPALISVINSDPLRIPGIIKFTNISASDFGDIRVDKGYHKIEYAGNIYGGEDSDIAIGSSSAQTFELGAGNDEIRFDPNWGTDTVKELPDAGTGDLLNFSTVAANLEFDIYHSAAAAGPKGVQVKQTGSSINKITDAANIEKLEGGSGTNIYRFHDYWGYFDPDPPDDKTPIHVFTIDDSAAGLNKGTLDFSDVGIDHTLRFELEGDGVVKVTATVVRHEGYPFQKNYEFIVKAKGIANLVGGKGVNTYVIKAANALSGEVKANTPVAPDQLNILDYSEYENIAAIIDLTTDDAPGFSKFLAPVHEVIGGGTGITFTADTDNKQTVTGSSGDDLLNASITQDILDGSVGNDTLNGSTGIDKLLGGSGQDSIYGLDNDDYIEGGTGNDTIEPGAGNDLVFGGGGDDILIAEFDSNIIYGNAGNDRIEIKGGIDNELTGGDGDDTYAISENWGTAEIFDGKNGGNDTIDFSGVTTTLTHVLNKGALRTGDGIFTPTNTDSWQRSFTATGDSSGLYTGSNLLEVPNVQKINPIQNVNLGNSASGSFTLSYQGNPSISIQYSEDKNVLAETIQKSLTELIIGNVFVSALKGAKITVMAGNANEFLVEFLNFNEPPPLLIINTAALKDEFDAAVTSTGVTLTNEVELGKLNEKQRIDFSLAGAPTGTFKIDIGGSISDAIQIGTTDEETRTNIDQKLDLLSQKNGFLSTLTKLISDPKFTVTVTVSGTNQFDVQFNAPELKDLPEVIILKQDGSKFVEAPGLVTTLQDGKEESGLANIENIVAANASNRFIFGDDWGVETGPAKEITVDTSLVSAGGYELEIDFSNVTNELNFKFESKVYSVQALDHDLSGGTVQLIYKDSETLTLNLNSQTSGTFNLSMTDPDGGATLNINDIKIVSGVKDTAYNIERAIEKEVSSFSVKTGVSVRVLDETLRTFRVTFHTKGVTSNLAVTAGSASLNVEIAAQQTTAQINFDADAATVAAELNKLKYANGENLDVTVIDGPSAAQRWIVSFDKADTTTDEIIALEISGGGAGKSVTLLDKDVRTSLSVSKIDNSSSLFANASPIGKLVEKKTHTSTDTL